MRIIREKRDAGEQVWFVPKTMEGSGGGTSPDNPWKILQFLLSFMVTNSIFST